MPELEKNIKITINYTSLTTNSMYPVLVKNNRIQNCNPFEEPMQNKIPNQYKIKI